MLHFSSLITDLTVIGPINGLPNQIIFPPNADTYFLIAVWLDGITGNGDITAMLTLSNPTEGTIGNIPSTTITILKPPQPTTLPPPAGM